MARKSFIAVGLIGMNLSHFAGSGLAASDRGEVMGFSKNGALVITAVHHDEPPPHRYSELVEIWDLANQSSRFQAPRVYNQSAWEVALSPDGRYLAVGRHGPQPNIITEANKNKSGEWDLWDIQAKRLIRHSVVKYGSVGHVAFSTDGNQLAIASQHENAAGEYDTSQVWMVDTATGKTLRTYRPGWSAIYSMAFSPDGQTLGLCGEVRPGSTLPSRSQPPLGIVQLWDAHAERLKQTFVQVDCSVMDITFSPQSDKIVCRRNYTNRSILDSYARMLTDSGPIENHLNSIDAASKADQERNFVMWNLKTGESVVWRGSSREPGLEIEIDRAQFAFSGDGRILSCLMRQNTPDPKYPASAGYIETHWVVRSWELDDSTFQESNFTLKTNTVLLEGSEAISRPRFSPDGTKVAAVDMKTHFRLWSAATGKVLRSWKVSP